MNTSVSTTHFRADDVDSVGDAGWIQPIDSPDHPDSVPDEPAASEDQPDSVDEVTFADAPEHDPIHSVFDAFTDEGAEILRNAPKMAEQQQKQRHEEMKHQERLEKIKVERLKVEERAKDQEKRRADDLVKSLAKQTAAGMRAVKEGKMDEEEMQRRLGRIHQIQQLQQQFNVQGTGLPCTVNTPLEKLDAEFEICFQQATIDVSGDVAGPMYVAAASAVERATAGINPERLDLRGLSKDAEVIVEHPRMKRALKLLEIRYGSSFLSSPLTSVAYFSLLIATNRNRTNQQQRLAYRRQHAEAEAAGHFQAEISRGRSNGAQAAEAARFS
jgi:hypothetical protein